MATMKLKDILINSENYKVCPYCESINFNDAGKCTICNTIFEIELPYYKTAMTRVKELIEELGKDTLITI